MKTFLLSSIFLAVIFPAFLHAQDDREDVMYLRSGAIYRGTIIEQVPGVSYRIEIAGGSVIYVVASEVEKIVREKIAPSISEPPLAKPRKRYIERDERDSGNVYKPKSKPDFHYMSKGYFFQARVVIGLEMGANVIAGYKFGRFGMLGAGIGISALENVAAILQGSDDLTEGPFATVFAWYGGDILKKQLTPFYSLHAGYGFNLQVHEQDYNSSGIMNYSGGIMGGVSAGVRLYTRKNRFNVGWAINFDIQQYHYSEPGGLYNVSIKGQNILYMPGTSISIGF